MSTVFFPNVFLGQIGKYTGMLKDILARIDIRLKALGLKESVAAKMAGLSDSAIRDMRRALKAGKEDAGVSSRTLIKLAPVLKTRSAWLLTGEGEENLPLGSLDRMFEEAAPELGDEAEMLREDLKRQIKDRKEMAARLRQSH